MAHLLIVDDSEMTHALIERMLKGEFEAFAHASDGQAALDLLEHSHVLPTVIVSDLEMPRMDGATMVREILGSEVLRQIPVVLCSSNPDLPAIAGALGVKCFQKGGSLLALKPLLLAMRDAHSNDGTHAWHCCTEHGCKYGDDVDCPVARPMGCRIRQECPCETCGTADVGEGFYDRAMVWHPSHRDLLLTILGEVGSDGRGSLLAGTLAELKSAVERIRGSDGTAAPENDTPSLGGNRG
jgi:CheY-like chemotaxis protein